MSTAYAAQKVSEALNSKLMQELARTERSGIMEDVTEPKNWFESTVVIEKKVKE